MKQDFRTALEQGDYLNHAIEKACFKRCRLPMHPMSLIKKYQRDLQSVKQDHLLTEARKSQLCPLIPICVYAEIKQSSQTSPRKGRRHGTLMRMVTITDNGEMTEHAAGSGLSGAGLVLPVNDLVASGADQEDADAKQDGDQQQQMVECCLSCHRVLELYKLRHLALTFQ